MVNVVVTEPKVTVNMRKPVASFENRIGTVGGTLGLMAGASIMSFFEVFFWLCVFVLRWIRRALQQRQKIFE